MKLRYLLAASAVSVLATTGAASAQQGTTSALFDAVDQLDDVDDDDRSVQQFGLSVDEVDDMDVHNTAGEEIGEVDEVLEDGAGQIVAVAVEFDDVLDDEEDRVVGLDQLQLQDGDLVTDLSEAQIEDLPSGTTERPRRP